MRKNWNRKPGELPPLGVCDVSFSFKTALGSVISVAGQLSEIATIDLHNAVLAALDAHDPVRKK